ncbi:hypothetical protein [Paenibacillus athensensis]|uniref:hypothetical protein n=1 Tax=Paenibacillus athensensis TaxID=1967502 RepID=UPI001E4C559B|nr:hypothetical protein [Paenibacillus athensensis]
MKQLGEAIDTHEQITNYMMQRSLYHPYHIPEQIQLDLKNIQTAMNSVLTPYSSRQNAQNHHGFRRVF